MGEQHQKEKNSFLRDYSNVVREKKPKNPPKNKNKQTKLTHQNETRRVTGRKNSQGMVQNPERSLSSEYLVSFFIFIFIAYVPELSKASSLAKVYIF